MREEIMNRKKQNERGVALLLAIFALFIVTSIGLGMMFLSDSETTVNSNFRDEQTAYYSAKAGIEEARDRMRSTSGSGITINASLPAAKPGAADGVLYVLNPTGSETVAPWTTSNAYFDDEICKEVSCGGGQVPPTSGWYVNPALTASSTYAASPVMPYKWMRITLKTDQSAAGTSNIMYVDGNSANAAYYVCWNGTNEVASLAACASPNQPVYLVTTLAVTKSGTRRMLQTELTRDSLNLTFPGALTLDGTSDVMSGPNSNPYQVLGADTAGCGGAAGGTTVPAIAVNDTADKTAVIAGIPSNRQSNYTGVGAAPDVEVATMPTNLQSVASLNSLLSTIKNNVTQPVLTGNQSGLSAAYLGSAASPQIIYIDGDLSLSGNTTGYGTLVVTGTFSPGGNVGWQGLVLVIGKGIVSGNGGGNNEYDGAIVVAQTVNPSTGVPLATLGAPTFSFSGGGGNGIRYSSGCINQASTLSDYRVVVAHELLY
jgi:hypothetical protein